MYIVPMEMHQIAVHLNTPCCLGFEIQAYEYLTFQHGVYKCTAIWCISMGTIYIGNGVSMQDNGVIRVAQFNME